MFYTLSKIFWLVAAPSNLIAIALLLGAALLILCGVINQEAAIRGIDFNTIGLLLGMMLIVNITAKSGVFQYMAIWSAKRLASSIPAMEVRISGGIFLLSFTY